MKCRHCGSELKLTLIDLGSVPLANAYLTRLKLRAPEQWFPLRVLVCESCWLVQTEDFAKAEELFDEEYAYFSGFSSSWLAHCNQYVLAMIERFSLSEDSYVVEIGANDGYLLQYVRNYGIPCLGIEPTASTATVARNKGIPIIQEFFGTDLAHKLSNQGKQADLTFASNVLAHVPNINDFVAGFSVLLKPTGVATFEFPYLLKLIAETQFDTIYHEHFSYLSLTAVNQIFSANGLSIFDVEEQPTHGGSLRVFAQRQDSRTHAISDRVNQLLKQESQLGISTANYYADFQKKANQIKNNFLAFLLEAQRQSKTVVGYGAAAKANTLMNYAGIRPDLIAFVVDSNPAKQGKFMPGSRIPIVDESHIPNYKPDYVIIFPWNIKGEIMDQLKYIRNWGGNFVTVIPLLEII